MAKSALSSNLVTSARSAPSLAFGGAEVVLAGIDKLTEHAVLSAVLEEFKGVFGSSRVLDLIRAHPWTSWILLSLAWAAFVYFRARKDHSDGSVGSTPVSPTIDVYGDRALALANVEAGGDVIQGGDKVYGNKIVTERPAAAPPCRPKVTIRLLQPKVDIQYQSRTIDKVGDLLTVQVISVVELKLSLLNSEPCATTIDTYSLDITTPSGRRISCTEINGILLENAMPTPNGLLRLTWSSAVLRQGETERRFVRYLVTEQIQMKDQPVANQMMFESLVDKARNSQEVYERDGIFRFLAVDSYGQPWEGKWPIV